MNAKHIAAGFFLIKILGITVEDWGYICLDFHETTDAFVLFIFISLSFIVHLWFLLTIRSWIRTHDVYSSLFSC